MSIILPSAQTRYDIGPFRFIRSLGGQLQIDRINLPWSYMDSTQYVDVLDDLEKLKEDEKNDL